MYFLNNFYIYYPIATKFSEIWVLIIIISNKNELFSIEITLGIQFDLRKREGAWTKSKKKLYLHAIITAIDTKFESSSSNSLENLGLQTDRHRVIL